MKVMISQPMCGKSNEQIKSERKGTIEKLNKMHIEVVDTIFNFEVNNINNTPVFYLAKSIEKMADVDAIYFMKNWQMARGCRVERKIAEEYGIKILDTDFLEQEEKIKRAELNGC